MPAWNELLEELNTKKTDAEKQAWIAQTLQGALAAVSQLRGGRNVIFYSSSFLQKPAIQPTLTMLTAEELNGLMSVMYGMDWDAKLTLVLHTPGGVTNAAETFVEYIQSKFQDVEVIVPTLSMSAGTMIALSANRIIMGRQSQLGPIDPQMQVVGGTRSARAIVEQFEAAKKDIVGEGGNLQNAHVWAAVLQSLGPSLLQEAQNALDYGEKMVARWLAARMFKDEPDAKVKGDAAARHFNDATTHKSHGRRIDRDEARTQGIVVEDLESNQQLQEAVLTAYHAVTLIFEHSPAAKLLVSNHGRMWVKNVPQPVLPQGLQAIQIPIPVQSPPRPGANRPPPKA